jgi:hypothetical protein
MAPAAAFMADALERDGFCGRTSLDADRARPRVLAGDAVAALAAPAGFARCAPLDFVAGVAADFLTRVAVAARGVARFRVEGFVAMCSSCDSLRKSAASMERAPHHAGRAQKDEMDGSRVSEPQGVGTESSSVE